MKTIRTSGPRVAAAIRITSPGEARLIERAASFSRRTGALCYVISIVSRLPDDAANEDERSNVNRNLSLIAEAQATPVMLEGDDVPQALIDAAGFFGFATLFIRGGRPRRGRLSIAERLIRLDPPFEVIVIGEQSG